MKVGDQIILAAKKQAEGELEVHKANIQVYIENPAGIGEHPDLVAAVDHEVCKLANAEDKLSSLKNNYIT